MLLSSKVLDWCLSVRPQHVVCEEYGQFHTDMTQVTIFDQARSTEALRLKAKAKKTGRGRSRSDVYKMLLDLQDKELLLRWQKLQVKTQLDQGLEFTLWRKWKPGDVGKLMDDVKLEDFDQVQEFIEYLLNNVYGDAQYMTLVLGRVDEILQQRLGIPAPIKAMQLAERIVEDTSLGPQRRRLRATTPVQRRFRARQVKVKKPSVLNSNQRIMSPSELSIDFRKVSQFGQNHLPCTSSSLQCAGSQCACHAAVHPCASQT